MKVSVPTPAEASIFTVEGVDSGTQRWTQEGRLA